MGTRGVGCPQGHLAALKRWPLAAPRWCISAKDIEEGNDSTTSMRRQSESGSERRARAKFGKEAKSHRLHSR